MESTNGAPDPRIEVYLRAGKPSVWEYQADVLERAKRLDDVEVVDDLRVRPCGPTVAA